MSAISLHQSQSTKLLEGFYSENYFEARSRFLSAAENNRHHLATQSIPIDAKGYNGEPLFVDISWIGPQDANKFIVHMSGTHGVEGFAGSAIQISVLKTLDALPENTAVIFIHAVNPYGMSHCRRVSEHNCDLNRNLTETRLTHPLYEKVDGLMNPKSSSAFEHFFADFAEHCKLYGSHNIITAVASGQYDFPEGLFYGGRKVEQAPQAILTWFEEIFKDTSKDVVVTIIDVHTGLGEYGEDTLLVSDSPSEQVLEMQEKYGPRIKAQDNQTVANYQPCGLLIDALRNCISKVTSCAKTRIETIGQEFGTYSNQEIMLALYKENTKHHEAERAGLVLDPQSPESQQLLRAFYPEDVKWRQMVIQRGQELFRQALK